MCSAFFFPSLNINFFLYGFRHQKSLHQRKFENLKNDFETSTPRKEGGYTFELAFIMTMVLYILTTYLSQKNWKLFLSPLQAMKNGFKVWNLFWYMYTCVPQHNFFPFFLCLKGWILFLFLASYTGCIKFVWKFLPSARRAQQIAQYALWNNRNVSSNLDFSWTLFSIPTLSHFLYFQNFGTFL